MHLLSVDEQITATKELNENISKGNSIETVIRPAESDILTK